jgi:hypothetical protein
MLQFQHCSAQGQLSGLATRGQPGALQVGFGHGVGSPRVAWGLFDAATGWLARGEVSRFGITDCMSSSRRRDGGQGTRGLGADAAPVVDPAVVVRARGGSCELGDGRRRLSAGDRAQSRWRRLLLGPLGAATPTGVLLAGHGCAAAAAQAWKMSVAHDSVLVPEGRSPIARRPPLIRRDGASVAEGRNVSQVTARRLTGRCPARSRFAGAVKAQNSTVSLLSRPVEN